MDAPVPASVPRTRFWRRVVVAGVWAAVVLGVLVGVFHRPLLRWGLDGAGRRLAARAGLVAWPLIGVLAGEPWWGTAMGLFTVPLAFRR